MKNKLLTFLTALSLAVSSPTPSGAVMIGSRDVLRPGANLTGTQVRFGSYVSDSTGTSTGPILWHVVSSGTGTRTLWTATRMKTELYNSLPHHQNWSGSTICAWLNGKLDGEFLKEAFQATEQAAIGEYGTGESETNIILAQQIVLPSVAEISDGGTWNIASDERALGGFWWLRTPKSGSTMIAECVDATGNVTLAGALVSGSLNKYAIYPALKLHLLRILFTSAASGADAKPAELGLAAAVPVKGAVKLTVRDDNLNLDCDETPRKVKCGDTVNIDYFGVRTGTGKHCVSCLIEDSEGEVLYYGKLGKLTDTGSGTASFKVPSGLDDGGYVIKLFNEQDNGDNLTDFASNPVRIQMTVTGSASAALTGCDAGIGTLAALALAFFVTIVTPRMRHHHKNYRGVKTK